MEWLFACECVNGIFVRFAQLYPGRGRKGVLRQRLRNAKSYQEWKEAALTMDDYLGFNEWKRVSGRPRLTSVWAYPHLPGRRGSLLRLSFGEEGSVSFAT